MYYTHHTQYCRRLQWHGIGCGQIADFYIAVYGILENESRPKECGDQQLFNGVLKWVESICQFKSSLQKSYQ